MTVPQYRRHECAVDRRVIHLQPLPTEMVALLLVAAPDRPVEYATLIEALWPDADQQPLTAVNIIHVMGSRLRRQGVPVEVEWGRGLFIAAGSRGTSAQRLAA